MSEGGRGHVDFVGGDHIPAQDISPDNIDTIANIIFVVKEPEYRWIEENTKAIHKWRARLRSIYLRWALAINSLEVSAKRYAAPAWGNSNQFVVESLRAEEGETKLVPIAVWDGPTASANHRAIMPMLASYGVIDMFAGLEEFVFELYRNYLNNHPEPIIKGEEFKELRKLRADPTKQNEWAIAWQQRLDSWHRNKIFDGLAKTFKGFCAVSGLKTPSTHTMSTIETWAHCIDMIAMLRNGLIHGAKTVSPELAQACNVPYAMTFDFEAGEPLNVELYHLQGIEQFTDQLLSAINLSLLERYLGKPLGSTDKK